MLFSHDEKDKETGNARRELQRLRRQDLLQLLVDQIHENDELRAQITERDEVVDELSSQDDRLKSRLDDKDVQIEHLKEKLDEKDVQIDRLKAKLNDKDALIERLKAKLDGKDQVLEDVYMVVRELAKADGAEVRAEHILSIESILADHFLLTRHMPSSKDPDHAQDQDSDASEANEAEVVDVADEEAQAAEDVPEEEVSE